MECCMRYIQATVYHMKHVSSTGFKQQKQPAELILLNDIDIVLWTDYPENKTILTCYN